MDYSNEQKAWTVIWYGISGSSKTVQIEFRKKFRRNAMTPNRSSIHRWWNKFFETNDLNKKKTKTMWVRTELKIEEVLAKFREDPHASLVVYQCKKICHHLGQLVAFCGLLS